MHNAIGPFKAGQFHVPKAKRHKDRLLCCALWQKEIKIAQVLLKWDRFKLLSIA